MTRPENQESGTQLHELVHQYFGDAVSVGTWSDMWLSEGHAEFYSSFDRRPGQEGPIPPRGAYERDAKNRALHGPPAAPKRPTDVVMGTNEGGHLTLYALRQEIGAERFRQVEQTFFDRFRDRSATTQDYIDTVNQVTGRDLTGFLRDWLYGPATPPMPGHPDWKPAPPRGR